MTCIIGYLDKDSNKIYMGADSAGVSGWNTRIRSDEKVFIRDNMIFGFTSSFRMGQLLQYALEIPVHEDSVDDYKYLCTSFITAVINCFRANGYLTIKDNEISGGTFLLGYKNRLYKIGDDFQVGECQDRFDACGCGDQYALGAMDVLHNRETLFNAEGKIRTALTSVAKFSNGVSAPFVIKCLEV